MKSARVLQMGHFARIILSTQVAMRYRRTLHGLLMRGK